MGRPVAGGGMPLEVPFAWHPFLMTCAFPLLMALGRYSYAADGLEGKAARRALHRNLMILGTLMALAGYAAIFRAHRPQHMLFGYNFALRAWAPAARVCHDWLGYAVLLLVLCQAYMGWAKLSALSVGRRAFASHESLGRLVLGLAAVNICLGVHIWMWGAGYSLLVAGLAVVSLLVFGVLAPAVAAGREAGEAPAVPLLEE